MEFLLSVLAAVAATAVATPAADLVARTPAPIVESVNGWDTSGCFLDSEQGTLSFLMKDDPNMTVEECIGTCSTAGLVLAGLEGGTRCFCGNIIKAGGTAASAGDCQIACGGNANEACGGPNGQRILIYVQQPPIIPEVVQSVGEWASIGCWSDSQQQRALHHDGGGSDGMTVEDCLSTCSAAGLPLAGVEFGLQCFCGNAVLYNQEPIAAVQCDTACAGNPAEMCGGSNAINIYQFDNTPFTSGPASFLQSFGDWSLLGCTQEASSGRAIPNSMDIPIEDMTVEGCLTACTAAGWAVAGLQFGEECRCGNVFLPPGPVLNDSSCELPCNGNANEFCGGPGANLVYFLPQAEKL